MKNTQPAWFLSHGAPNVILTHDLFTETLSNLAKSLPERPRAIVIVSAHSESPSDAVQVWTDSDPKIDYDFRGFQPELYQMTYPCPGSPELAAQIGQRLSAAGLGVELVRGRRMDHGVWIPLKMIFPEADIPVVQIALPQPHRPDEGVVAPFLKAGRALAEMRQDGVLLIGSGGAVHNLSELEWHGKSNHALAWAADFEQWLVDRLEARDVAALVEFEEQGPNIGRAHPTHDHLLPLFFPLGATLPQDRLDWIFRGFHYRSLSMLCVGFVAPIALPGARPNLPH